MAIKFSGKKGYYECFSNFYECNIEFEGLYYKSSEAAWQAQKSLSADERKKFCDLSASKAKKRGRQTELRGDWEEVKYQLMVDICKAKFTQNSYLMPILLGTKDEELIEDTTPRHDNIWGNCECKECKNIEGKNLLGKALMEVRSKLSRTQDNVTREQT